LIFQKLLVSRLCGQTMRRLTPDVSERKLLNNEVKFRDWLLYSKSISNLFCGPCRIFSSIHSQFSETGFNNWKKVLFIIDNKNKIYFYFYLLT